jgi:hypothetical protein
MEQYFVRLGGNGFDWPGTGHFLEQMVKEKLVVSIALLVCKRWESFKVLGFILLPKVAIPGNCPPIIDFKGKSSKDYLLPFLDNGKKGIRFLLGGLQGF